MGWGRGPPLAGLPALPSKMLHRQWESICKRAGFVITKHPPERSNFILLGNQQKITFLFFFFS